MNLKRFPAILIATILCISFTTNIKAMSYTDALTRLKDLGILDQNAQQNSIMTRGEFVKAISNASGLGDKAYSYRGTSIFPDIKAGSELSGYVNAAVDKGLMNGLSDGKFHPESFINYAQICTIMVKALGYTDDDLEGTWPKNYVSKAKELGISQGVSLNYYDEVQLQAAASMIDRLLDTDIKKADASDADKTYGEASGISNDSYQYAMISDPIYSNPEVATDISRDTKNIGSIDLSGNPAIIKDGVPISITDIEENDVVYQVSDVTNTKKYILVVDNKVSGEITSFTSSQIEIDGVTYKYGQGMDFNKVLESYGSIEVGDYVTILLGYDGKVVDFFNTATQDNSQFAYVINYSNDMDEHRVKLLMIDGNIREFKTKINPESYKGKLVVFSKLDEDTVTFNGLSYSDTGSHIVNRDLRMLDGDYVSHNVKIFNIIDDNRDSDEDSNVELANWSELSSGEIESGKILYVNRTGTYNDINFMVTNDLFEDRYKIGIVNDVETIKANVKTGEDENGKPIYDEKTRGYNYKILVDGTEYSWSTNDSDKFYGSGSVLRVVMSNGSIDKVKEKISYEALGSKLQAADVNRLKINNDTYFLKGKPQVYFKTTEGDYILKEISDIEVNRAYKSVAVYLDKSLSNGGKVVAIVVQ